MVCPDVTFALCVAGEAVHTPIGVDLLAAVMVYVPGRTDALADEPQRCGVE